MNEQAVTLVCSLFATICALLFWGAARYNDQGAMILGMVFSIVVVLLSGYVVIFRYL